MKGQGRNYAPSEHLPYPVRLRASREIIAPHSFDDHVFELTRVNDSSHKPTSVLSRK